MNVSIVGILIGWLAEKFGKLRKEERKLDLGKKVKPFLQMFLDKYETNMNTKITLACTLICH